MGAELRDTARLAWPICLSSLGTTLMGAVDTFWLGRYSDTAVAGAGIGNGVVFFVIVVGMGAVMGLDTLAPQAVGAGDRARARRLYSAGLRLAVLVGLPLCVLGALSPPALRAFGVEAVVADEASRYIYARLPGVVPLLMFTAARSYLQALEITRPAVVAMAVGNGMNAALDYALIFGIPSLGVPELGAVGAGATSSVVAVALFAVMAVSVRMTDQEVETQTGPYPVAAIAAAGAPVGLMFAAEVGVFTLTSVLAGTLGTLPAAAHQVALACASVTFSGAMGLGAATAVRVGHAVGAGQPARARRAGAAGLTATFVYMTATAVLFVSLPASLARLFTDEPAVIEVAVPLLQIAALFQLSDGAQAVGAGALRGLGDNRAGAVANVVGHYAIGVPVMFALAFAAGLGAQGLWLGLSAGLTAVAIGLWWRFFRRATFAAALEAAP